MCSGWVFWLGLLVAFLSPAGTWAAVWHEAEFPYRRPVVIDVDPQKITGEELADVRFLANGKQRPDGRDIRVTTIAGKAIPFRLVSAGPADMMDVAFNPVKGVRDYFIYFGSGQPAEQAAELNAGGLLFETKSAVGEAPGTAKELEAKYDGIPQVVGRRILAWPYLGNNPFPAGVPSMAKLTGKLFAPLTGKYVFSVGGENRAALFIDGKPVVFMKHPTRDARFQETIELTRGKHDFRVIHQGGGEFVLCVAWKRPDMEKFDVVGREFFTPIWVADAGPLETKDKPLTADLGWAYMGESFFNWNYSHRYRFDVASSLKNVDRMDVTWEFGDGQTGRGRQVEHVYLNPGTYAIRVTTRLAGNTDTQAFRLAVDRDSDRISSPPTDELQLQAKFVAGYDLTTLSAESLAHAVMMQTRAGMIDDALRAAEALVARPEHPNRSTAMKAISELRDELRNRNQSGRLRKVFAASSAKSDLEPALTTEHAQWLIYDLGEFAEALTVISPQGNSDDAARRAFGQALILNGQFDKGRQILEALPVQASVKKGPAMSGAMARSTEFYVEDKDAFGGEQAWDKWMMTFPADFLDGNAALMRARLFDIRGNAALAARFAEAYANGNRQSAYAPKLLDLSSRLLAKSDPERSRQLRELLRTRYPEDPLSQK